MLAAITQSKLGDLDIDRHTAQNKGLQFQFFQPKSYASQV
jgi:hypothetical protein